MAKYKEIRKAINSFSVYMIDRMDEKEADGWEGWNSKRGMDLKRHSLKERIIKNVIEGDWIDVANLAMIAWNLDL